MFCTTCGKELGASARFCSACGKSTGTPPRPARLCRVTADRKIAGVCAGFARYLEVDVTLVRIVWLSLAIGTGIGFIAYLIAWIVMPRDIDIAPAPNRQPESV